MKVGAGGRKKDWLRRRRIFELENFLKFQLKIQSNNHDVLIYVFEILVLTMEKAPWSPVLRIFSKKSHNVLILGKMYPCKAYNFQKIMPPS